MAEKSFATTIKTIYFYFFAGLGLILLIVGIFQLSQWGVKSFVLPKYSLTYEDTRCDYLPTKIDNLNSEQTGPQQTKEECLVSLEEQRQTRQVTDLANAFTFIFVGGVVFAFHFRRTSLLSK